jgi:hypothetical protein
MKKALEIINNCYSFIFNILKIFKNTEKIKTKIVKNLKLYLDKIID